MMNDYGYVRVAGGNSSYDFKTTLPNSVVAQKLISELEAAGWDAEDGREMRVWGTSVAGSDCLVVWKRHDHYKSDHFHKVVRETAVKIMSGDQDDDWVEFIFFMNKINTDCMQLNIDKGLLNLNVNQETGRAIDARGGLSDDGTFWGFKVVDYITHYDSGMSYLLSDKEGQTVGNLESWKERQPPMKGNNETFIGWPEDRRKEAPISGGFFKYFRNAIYQTAHQSWLGNQQHHPDKPLHWDMSKSTDELDACLRHLDDYYESRFKDEPRSEQLKHLRAFNWRSNAALERFCQGEDI